MRLQNERGSQKYGLPQLCKQTGFDSVWCTLDAIGAETETTLTFAFRACFRGGGPVAADSAAQLLRHAAVRRRAGRRQHAVGLPSATYNALMLLCMLAFWALTTWGLFQYSLHTPATLGMGAAYYDRSYGLLRACVLYASLGSVTLLALALSLWDTQTAQMLVAEALAARFHKQWLYWMLSIQMVLYLVVALDIQYWISPR